MGSAGHRREVLVHFEHHQYRTGNVCHGPEHDGGKRNSYLPPIWPQVDQQAPHQPAVISFSQDFFFSGHQSFKVTLNRWETEPAGWKRFAPQPVRFSSSAEFFEPNPTQLQMACSMVALRPTSGT